MDGYPCKLYYIDYLLNVFTYGDYTGSHILWRRAEPPELHRRATQAHYIAPRYAPDGGRETRKLENSRILNTIGTHTAMEVVGTRLVEVEGNRMRFGGSWIELAADC